MKNDIKSIMIPLNYLEFQIKITIKSSQYVMLARVHDDGFLTVHSSSYMRSPELTPSAMRKNSLLLVH